MKLADLIKISVYNLTSNKLRSVLTMLGIIIGVASVIALQSVGEGSIQEALEKVERAGTNLVTVSPNNQSFGGVSQSGQRASLTLGDAEALATLSTVAAVAPEYFSVGQVVAGRNNTASPIVGTTADYPVVHDQALASGSWFDDGDVKSTKQVVILGSRVAAKLFPDGDAVGKSIRLERLNFKVVGVMTAKGGNGFGSTDDRVYVPVTVAQAKLFGFRQSGALGTDKSVTSIVLKAKNAQSVELLIKQATELLRERHKGQDDFKIDNQQDQLQAARDQQKTLNLFLLAIASISLFVGGIGIMNIMLVTVTERTREIGIRKAIGAKPFDILRQFLIESITLCFFGGLLGVILGTGASLLVNQTIMRTALNLPVIFMAVGFALIVGLFFGIYPARRAARLHPIEALRYE